MFEIGSVVGNSLVAAETHKFSFQHAAHFVRDDSMRAGVRQLALPFVKCFRLRCLLAGGVFAFALSMLEVSDSLILAQRQATFPITKAIYDLFQLLGDGRHVAAALGVWAMLFLLSAFAVARSLLGGKLGNMFRL